MDIRDILKSFDNLSEATTTTDKGVTTHKGDYGREFDTDDEGNAIVKKVKSTEPKPKGRRPDPDRPKLGKDDPKNKKVGDLFGRTTGAVPKGKKGTAISGKAQSHPDNKNDDGTGDEETTSKKSLKEYFDQLDQALNEEGYSTAPMPGAVAVKDASGKVVATAKNPQAAAAFEKGDITIGGDEQGMAEGEMDEAVRAGYATTDWMKTPKKSAFEPATSHIRRPTNQAERDEVAAAVKNNRIGNKDYRINRIGAKSAAYGLDHTGYEDEYSMVRAQQDKGNTPKQWKMIPTAGDGKGLEEMDGPYDDDKVDAINAANPPKVSGTGMKPVTPAVHHTYDRKAVASNISGKDSAAYDQFTGRDKVTEKDVGKHNNATTGFEALVRKLTPKYGKEAATKIAGAQLKKMSEAEQPQHFAQSSPLTFEGKKGVNPFAKKEETDKKKCPPMSHVKKMCEKGMSMAKICTMHPDCDQKELKKMVTACKKTLKEATFKQEYRIFLESKGIKVTNEMLEEGWKEKLAAAGTAAAIGATSLGMMGGLPGQNPADSSVMRPTGYSQQVQAGAPVTAKAEALAKINKQFAKEYQDGYLKIQDDPVLSSSPKLANQETIKFTQELLAKYQANESKKPDANKNRIPDYAEDGKGKNDLTKKGAAPKKGVNPFAKKDEKKKVKEGMEHHLQAARLEGKSHALRKMPYNCSHDDMEEARCYHDGFKEGLDECYGQMPILGRTRVGEMGQGPEVSTMASYGADDMGMDEGNAFTAGLAKTPHGGKFNVGGSTFTDRTRYDSNLDEFAFEALDKQLNAILEGKEVSEGMTVSISKGQQGAPDSVSVSAQDGEADQLLSIIKSAGMGLFGGDEQNGYGAPQGSAGAHGGISVVDDHDGMMALMKKLSGNGGEMQGGGDYEDEEGHERHGEEEHMHGHEETCESCGGMMEENHQCGSNEMVDEVESEDQMMYNVVEDNPPDSGAADTAADDASEAGEDDALATADAAQDMATAKTYSSPTEGKEDTTGEEAGKEKVDEGDNCKKCDCNPCKCETVAESFANLYKKLAFLSEESTEKKDEKAEKAGKKVANDIEDDEGHKGKDDDTAEKAGKKVTKDIEYDDKKDEKYKKDKKVDESYANSADDTFEADIDFMTKVISGGLNKQKSTGQTTVPVVSGQKSRMGVDGLGNPLKESTDLLRDYRKLSGL